MHAGKVVSETGDSWYWSSDGTAILFGVLGCIEFSASAASFSFCAVSVEQADVCSSSATVSVVGASSSAAGFTFATIGKDRIGCLAGDTFSDSTSTVVSAAIGKPLGARWCCSLCFSAAASLSFASWMRIGVLAAALCLNLQPPAPEKSQLPLARYL